VRVARSSRAPPPSLRARARTSSLGTCRWGGGGTHRRRRSRSPWGRPGSRTPGSWPSPPARSGGFTDRAVGAPPPIPWAGSNIIRSYHESYHPTNLDTGLRVTGHAERKDESTARNLATRKPEAPSGLDSFSLLPQILSHSADHPGGSSDSNRAHSTSQGARLMRGKMESDAGDRGRMRVC
jgi:hypothetical protein